MKLSRAELLKWGCTVTFQGVHGNSGILLKNEQHHINFECYV